MEIKFITTDQKNFKTPLRNVYVKDTPKNRDILRNHKCEIIARLEKLFSDFDLIQGDGEFLDIEITLSETISNDRYGGYITDIKYCDKAVQEKVDREVEKIMIRQLRNPFINPFI